MFMFWSQLHIRGNLSLRASCGANLTTCRFEDIGNAKLAKLNSTFTVCTDVGYFSCLIL